MLLKEEVCIVADVSLKDMTYRGECVDVWNDILLLYIYISWVQGTCSLGSQHMKGHKTQAETHPKLQCTFNNMHAQMWMFFSVFDSIIKHLFCP